MRPQSLLGVRHLAAALATATLALLCWASGAAAATYTFPAVADARAEATSPNSNFGGSPDLNADLSPQRESFADSTASRMDLMMTGANANKVTDADGGLGAYWFDSERARLNGNEHGDQTQGPFGPRRPSLKFESLADFRRMVAAGTIDPAIRTVKYDPENWSLTPTWEKENLPLAMKQFIAECRAAGFAECGLAPSRDILLHNSPTTWCSRYGGGASNLDDAYLNKCNIPARMAEANPDFAQVQSQTKQDSVTAYRDFLSRAVAKARAVNPSQAVWGGLSTNYDNEGGRDMTRAVQATYPSIVTGFYYTISSDAVAGEAVPHLRALQAQFGG